jgi:hypothetical protein
LRDVRAAPTATLDAVALSRGREQLNKRASDLNEAIPEAEFSRPAIMRQ